MSSAALPVEIIPGHRESHSGIGRKPFAFPPESLFVFSPESLFVFAPESFSRSPRNPVRLAPESPARTTAT
jgi:hypothetical protein